MITAKLGPLLAITLAALAACASGDETAVDEGSRPDSLATTTAQEPSDERRSPAQPGATVATPSVPQPRLDSPRHPFPARLDLRWQVESSDADTVLLLPNDVQHSVIGLLVFDAGDRTVQVFDAASGRFVRRLGREGAGPGEFHFRAQFSGSFEEPVAFDADQKRFTPLNVPRAEMRTVSLPSDHRWIRSCALDGDGMFLTRTGTLGASGPDFFVASAGTVTDSMDLPFEDLRTEPCIGRQAVLARLDDSACAVLTLYQSRFAVYQRDRGFSLRGTYVEVGPKPSVTLQENPERGQRGYALPPGTVAGPYDAAAWRHMVLVLFEGRSHLRRRRLDVYRRSDLAYQGSIVLPLKSRSIAVRGDTITVIGEQDDYPVLATFLVSGTDVASRDSP